MRKFIILLLLALPFSLAAQTEFTLSFGSGLFFFGGNSAFKNSKLLMDNENNTVYIQHPFGRKPSFSLNLSQDAHYCTKSGFLLGMNFGFNYLRSATNLQQIDYRSEDLELFTSNAVLKMYDASVTPFVGKRFHVKNWDVDISGGAEVAFPVYAEFKANIISRGGNVINAERKTNVIERDIRPVLKVNTYYKKYGFFSSYSHGLSNYAEGLPGANMKVYSRLIRAGVNYRLQK